MQRNFLQQQEKKNLFKSKKAPVTSVTTAYYLEYERGSLRGRSQHLAGGVVKCGLDFSHLSRSEELAQSVFPTGNLQPLIDVNNYKTRAAVASLLVFESPQKPLQECRCVLFLELKSVLVQNNRGCNKVAAQEHQEETTRCSEAPSVTFASCNNECPRDKQKQLLYHKDCQCLSLSSPGHGGM